MIDVVRMRFGPEIDRLRMTLRGKRDVELIAAVRRDIESLGAAVLVANDTAHYVAANRAATDLLGFSPAEIETLSVSDLTPLPDAGSARLWREFITVGA